MIAKGKKEKTCVLCNMLIDGSYEYSKTNRKTIIYFHKVCYMNELKKDKQQERKNTLQGHLL